MGVMAAKMCKAAGFVGGMEIPPISEALTGFINGAKSVDPNFKVYSTYIGNFDDAAAAKEAALSMIAQGADCIVPDADAAGQGVFQAVVEKKDRASRPSASSCRRPMRRRARCSPTTSPTTARA